MNNLLSRLWRTATIAVAVAGVAATIAVPSANAAALYNESRCTPADSPNNTDGVLTRSCWLLASEVANDPSVEGYSPSVKMRIPSLDGTKWSTCAVNVAVFWKPSGATSYSRYQTDSWRTDGTSSSTPCIGYFQAQSGSTAVVYYHGDPVVIQPKACYYVIARWWGKYNGQDVGINASGPFPQSTTLCGKPTGVDVLDSSVSGPDLGDSPGGMVTVSVE
jgi:hypothetical protein